MKTWQHKFYSSIAWRRMSELIKKRDAYLCQDCLKEGKQTPAEVVHHITEVTALNVHDPSITLEPNNLVSLCRECHAARHGARQRRYKTDAMGRVTIL